jgi:hypothetical protein
MQGQLKDTSKKSPSIFEENKVFRLIEEIEKSSQTVFAILKITEIIKNFDYKLILDFRAWNGVHTKPPPKLQLNIL